MLTPQQYEKRRNELIILLDEAVSLDVPEKYAAELKATVRKCKEDQFEIALVGEFQGGKSTTFNALCDGRDISPRGLGGGGIKTSAAVITAQNISDGSTKGGFTEWAEISFKSPAALSFGLYDLLHGPLLANSDFRATIDKTDEIFIQDMMTDSGFASLVDLRNPKHRACIVSVLQTLWSRWEKNKGSVSDEELDLLRIATLQMRYFDTPEYKALVDKTLLSIESFQKLVAFPKDWAKRWTNGMNANFTLEECAFVFIDSVLVRIHSKNLERLGCRVTDCPGLFANAYDTAVAKRTICNADGIWYLLNGEKQVGQKDIKILRTINSLQMLNKLEATSNLRGDQEQKIREILPVTKSVLENAGIKIDVFPYNARLAFLATQGDLLINRPSDFSELDRACMMVDAKEKNSDADNSAMWARMVRRMGSSTEIAVLEDVAELNAENVKAVRKESYLDEILGNLEKGAVAKKSRSILIDKGSARAAKALLEYEGALKVVEDAARAKEDEWRAKVEAARSGLNEFIKRANKAIDRSALLAGKSALAASMARELVRASIDEQFIDEVAKGTSAVLGEVSKSFYMTYSSMQKAIVGKLTPIFKEAFQSAILRAAQSWRCDRSRSASLTELYKRSCDVCDELHELWEDRHLQAEKMFDGFDPPAIDEEEFSANAFAFVDGLFVDDSALGEIAESNRSGFFTLIFNEVILPACLALIAYFIFPPAAIAVAAVKVVKMIWDAFKSPEERDEEKRQEVLENIAMFEPEIKPKLEESFRNNNFGMNVTGPMVSQFEELQDQIIDKLRKALNQLSIDFKRERCDKPEATFKKSAAEREAVAAENRRIRTEQIQPLRERIEAFEDAVEKELD